MASITNKLPPTFDVKKLPAIPPPGDQTKELQATSAALKDHAERLGTAVADQQKFNKDLISYLIQQQAVLASNGIS